MDVEIFKKSLTGLLLLFLADINSALLSKENNTLSKKQSAEGTPRTALSNDLSRSVEATREFSSESTS